MELTVASEDTWLWPDITIKINYGVFAGGYQVQLDHLGPGQSVAIPLSEFVDSDGARFNPMTHKVPGVMIHAYDGPPSVSGRKLYISEYKTPANRR